MLPQHKRRKHYWRKYVRLIIGMHILCGYHCGEIRVVKKEPNFLQIQWNLAMHFRYTSLIPSRSLDLYPAGHMPNRNAVKKGICGVDPLGSMQFPWNLLYLYKSTFKHILRPPCATYELPLDFASMLRSRWQATFFLYNFWHKLIIIGILYIDGGFQKENKRGSLNKENKRTETPSTNICGHSHIFKYTRRLNSYA